MTDFETAYIAALDRIAEALEGMAPRRDPADLQIEALNREITLAQLQKQKDRMDRGEDPFDTSPQPEPTEEELEMQQLARRVQKMELQRVEQSLQRAILAEQHSEEART